MKLNNCTNKETTINVNSKGGIIMTNKYNSNQHKKQAIKAARSAKYAMFEYYDMSFQNYVEGFNKQKKNGIQLIHNKAVAEKALDSSNEISSQELKIA